MNKFIKILIPLLIVIFVFSISHARKERDWMVFDGIVTIDGVVQEQTAQTDGTSICFEGTTVDDFQTCFVITDPTADRTITFQDAATTVGSAANHTTLTTITVTDTTTNTVSDLLTTSHTGGTVAAGFGTGYAVDMEDAGGVEEQGRINFVFTTVTDAAEDVDVVVSQNDNGTISETLRIIADADGTTEGTRIQLTSASAETNGVNDLIVLKASGGTTVAGFGVGIDYQAEFADGVETACKSEAVWTDVGTGSEDADYVMSCKDAGTLAELARFDSDGNLVLEGATSDGNQLTITPTDPAADRTLTLPTTTNAAAMITALTTNDVDVANSIWGVSNGLAMGGATGANGFEVTISPQTDPAGSVTVSVPSLTNAAAMISSLTTNDIDVANSVWGVSNGLAFGGATGANGFELTLSAQDDPAADIAVSIPNTVASTLLVSSLTTNDIDVANSIWGVSNGLAFGGATGANGFEVTVSPGADPGADVALTLPTASGAIPTVIGTGSFKTVESLTATDVQTSADCGKTLLLTHATVAIVVTLPAPAGLSGCEFWVLHNLATNQDHTIVTNASANIIRGSIAENQGAAGSYQAIGDLITFVNTAESVGDRVHLITDGTSWFVDGLFELNGGITQGST